MDWRSSCASLGSDSHFGIDSPRQRAAAASARWILVATGIKSVLRLHKANLGVPIAQVMSEAIRLYTVCGVTPNISAIALDGIPARYQYSIDSAIGLLDSSEHQNLCDGAWSIAHAISYGVGICSNFHASLICEGHSGGATPNRSSRSPQPKSG